MGHSAPNSSDNTIIHPRSLAERLNKVEADAEPSGPRTNKRSLHHGARFGTAGKQHASRGADRRFTGSIRDHRSHALARRYKNALVDGCRRGQ